MIDPLSEFYYLLSAAVVDAAAMFLELVNRVLDWMNTAVNKRMRIATAVLRALNWLLGSEDQ